MNRHFALLAVCATGLTLGDDKPLPTAKDELKKFDGAWRLVTLEQDGVKIGKDQADVTWLFDGEKYTLKVGTSIQEGTLRVAVDKDRHTIDLTVTAGDGKGKVYKGIYKFVDKELVLCFPKDTALDRPTELTGKAGSGQHLYVLQRSK
jgi:uncharacterized protein (TIGR03067 family)